MMRPLYFDKATREERNHLSVLRAGAWAKDLPPNEFVKRNQVLYSHPFGKKRIETYVLKDSSGTIVSSMDALQLNFFMTGGLDKPILEKAGFLIASVITPIDQRGRGYASHLLDEFLKIQPWDVGVLHSDVGPAFYEKWGFKKTEAKLYEVDQAVSQPPTSMRIEMKSIDLESFIHHIYELRKKQMVGLPEGKLMIAPEVEFWDWQIERFRFYSKFKGIRLPSPYFEAQLAGEYEYFSVVQNSVTGKAEVLWRDSTRSENLAAIASVVKDWGMKHFSYWANSTQGKVIQEECPMGWRRGKIKFLAEDFLDPQLCDWW
ncbi:MAG: N-acetyltransferase [Bdellovibrionales bacterium]|nr:N-acetyltransferase [Bdellovibrionales bacterium]